MARCRLACSWTFSFLTVGNNTRLVTLCVQNRVHLTSHSAFRCCYCHFLWLGSQPWISEPKSRKTRLGVLWKARGLGLTHKKLRSHARIWEVHMTEWLQGCWSRHFSGNGEKWIPGNIASVHTGTLPSSFAPVFLILCIFPLHADTCSFQAYIHSLTHSLTHSFTHSVVTLVGGIYGQQKQQLCCPQGVCSIMTDTAPRNKPT